MKDLNRVMRAIEVLVRLNDDDFFVNVNYVSTQDAIYVSYGERQYFGFKTDCCPVDDVLDTEIGNLVLKVKSYKSKMKK